MQFLLNAEKRTLQGSSASRRLRRAGKVPGIIYGADKTPDVVLFDHNQLYQALRKEAFHSSVLAIEIEGKKQQVLLRDFQVHAYKPLVLHADFQRVSATEKLHQKVPLHFLNADLAPGVKLEGGIISHIMNEIEVSCLPADLPEFIEVDLQEIKAGESLHISQLKLPKGVAVIGHGDDQAVVSCIGKRGGNDESAAADAPAE